MDKKEIGKCFAVENEKEYEENIFKRDVEIMIQDMLEQVTKKDTIFDNEKDELEVHVTDIKELLSDLIDQVVSTGSNEEDDTFSEQYNGLRICKECSNLLNEMIESVSENNLQGHYDLLKSPGIRESDIRLSNSFCSDNSITNLRDQIDKIKLTDNTNFTQTPKSDLKSPTHQHLKVDQLQPVAVKDFDVSNRNINQKDDEVSSNTTTSDRFEFELDDLDVLESCDLVKSDTVNHIDIQSLPPDDIESVWEFYDSESMTESDFEDMITTDFCQIVPTDVAMTYANQNGNNQVTLQQPTTSTNIESGHPIEIAVDVNKLAAEDIKDSVLAEKETLSPSIESRKDKLPVTGTEKSKANDILQNLTVPSIKSGTDMLPATGIKKSKANDILQNHTVQTKVKLNYSDLKVSQEGFKTDSSEKKSECIPPTYSKQISVDSASSENSASNSSSVESDTSSGKRKHDFPISITHLTKYFTKGKRAIFSSKHKEAKLLANKKKDVKHQEKYDSDDSSAPSSSSDLSDEDDLKDPADTGFESDSSTDLEEQIKGRQKNVQNKKSVKFLSPDDNHAKQKQAIEEKYNSLRTQQPNKEVHVTNNEVRPIQKNFRPQLMHQTLPGTSNLNLSEINNRYPSPLIPPPGIRPIGEEGLYGVRQFPPGFQRPMMLQPRGYFDIQQAYPPGPMTRNPMPFPVANHENIPYGQNHPPMYNPIHRYPNNMPNIPNYNQRLPFNLPAAQPNPWLHQRSPVLARRQPNSPILPRRSTDPSLQYHFNHDARSPMHRPVRPQFPGPPRMQNEGRRHSDSHSVNNQNVMREWVADLDKRCNRLGRAELMGGEEERDYDYQEEVIQRRFGNSDSEEEEAHYRNSSRRTRRQTPNYERFTYKHETGFRSEYNIRTGRSRRPQSEDRYSPSNRNKTKIHSDSYNDFMAEFAKDLTNPNVSKRERRFRCDVLEEVHKLMPAFSWSEMLNFYDDAVERFQRIFHSELSIPRKESAVKKILVEMVDDILQNEHDDIGDRYSNASRRTSSNTPRPNSLCDENVARSLYKNGSRQCEYVTTTTMLCKAWNRSGYCRQGTDCPYKHCCIRCATEDERTAHHPALECPYFDD